MQDRTTIAQPNFPIPESRYRHMRIGLRIINQFQVNQHIFLAGKFMPEEIVTELNTVDPSQLANRLNNGYVKWEPVPEDTETEKAVDIDGLDKAGLIEYAAQVFPGVKLDQRQSVENLRQQVKAIQERHDLLAGRAAAQAARSGESARSGGGSSSASSAKPSAKAKQPDPPAAPPAPVVGDDPPAGGTGDQGGAAGDRGTGTGDGNAGTGGGSPPA